MLIHLSEFCQTEGKTEKLEVEYEPECFSISGVDYPLVDKENAVISMVCPEKNKVRLSGTFSVHSVVPCDRCLDDVTVSVSANFERDIDIVADGAELNTDELLYKEILMEWPMKILCKEECKGLCFKCGANLNEGQCDCDRTVLDPRMAAFLDVFNNSKN